ADHQRKAGVGVQGRVVLNLRTLAQLDPLVVAAQHRTEPDAGVSLEPHAADQHRGLGDPVATIAGEFGLRSVKLVDRHSHAPCSGATLPRPANVDEPGGRQANRWPSASNAITTTVPENMLQMPATMVASMTNSKRRCSMRRPRIVLRMMMKGAANTRNGT